MTYNTANGTLALDTLTLDANIITGGIRKTNTGALTIAASGANALTLDGTGISSGNNGFGNANTATISNSNTGALIVNPNLILATNTDVGVSSTGNLTLGGNITASAASNLNFRTNNTGTISATGSIGASGSNIAISNLGTSSGAVNLSGVIGSSVNSITQNSSFGGLTILAAANNSNTGTLTVNSATLTASSSLFAASQTPLGTAAVTLNGGTLSLLTGGATGSGAGNTNAETVTFGNNVAVGGNTTINVGRTATSNAATSKTIALNNLSIGANTLTVTGANGYLLQFVGTTTITGNSTFSISSANLALAGAIGDGGSGFGIIKAGPGTLFLGSAASTYTGGTSITAGAISVSSIGNQTSTSSGLGGSYSTINLGATTNGGILIYTGAGETTDRVLNLASTTGSSQIQATNASSLLNFTGNVTATGVGNKTLTVSNTGAGGVQLSGAISDNSVSNTTALTKTNSGTLTLSGNSTFTGSLGVNQGILQVATISNAGVSSNIGAGNAIFALTSSGGTGTLRLTGAGGSTDRAITIIRSGTGTGSGLVIDSSGSAPYTFSGGISTSAAAAVSSSSTVTNTLTLTGNNTGANTISGNITDFAADRTIAVAKSNTTALWILSGTGNDYTGQTTVNGGSLAGIGANAFGNTSGISIAGAGILSLRGDSSTSFVKASDSSSYTITTSASGATINADQATVAGTGAKTMSVGAIGTSSTAVAYTINFTGSNNTSLSVGAITGAASAAAGANNIANAIAGGGSLTVASFASANSVGGDLLRFNGVGNTTVTGAITPSSTTLSLQHNGTGTVTLSGANTYNGTTTINSGGTLSVAALTNGGGPSSTLGVSSNAASNLVINGGTLRYTGSGDSTDRLFTIGNAAPDTATIDSSGSGALNFTNTGALVYGGSQNTARTLILDGSYTGAANTMASLIAASGTVVKNVTKQGAGTWRLTNANTYDGATTVTAGTLLINGSIAAGAVSVNGGTLGGNGTVGGATTLAAGSKLSAGDSSAETLTLTSTLNLSAAANDTAAFVFTLGLSGADRIRLTSNTANVLNIGTNLLSAADFSFSAGSGFGVGQTYTLFDLTGGSATINGTFTTFSTTIGGFTGDVAIVGNDIVLTNVVPEPATWALLALGLTVLITLRRRRTS